MATPRTRSAVRLREGVKCRQFSFLLRAVEDNHFVQVPLDQCLIEELVLELISIGAEALITGLLALAAVESILRAARAMLDMLTAAFRTYPAPPATLS